jgi:hypothetical protein
MRKWLIMLVAVLGFAAQAQAQDFSIRAGATLYFTNPVLFAIDAKLYATQVTRIGPGIDLGIIGGINLFLPNGGVGGIVGAGPALVFSFDRGAGFAYFGVNLGIVFATNSNTSVIFALIGGVDYAINSSIGLFADLFLGVTNGIGGSLDLGVDFGLSRNLDAYVKLNVLFGGSVGIGGGLKFAL